MVFLNRHPGGNVWLWKMKGEVQTGDIIFRPIAKDGVQSHKI